MLRGLAGAEARRVRNGMAYPAARGRSGTLPDSGRASRTPGVTLTRIGSAGPGSARLDANLNTRPALTIPQAGDGAAAGSAWAGLTIRRGVLPQTGRPDPGRIRGPARHAGRGQPHHRKPLRPQLSRQTSDRCGVRHVPEVRSGSHRPTTRSFSRVVMQRRPGTKQRRACVRPCFENKVQAPLHFDDCNLPANM